MWDSTFGLYRWGPKYVIMSLVDVVRMSRSPIPGFLSIRKMRTSTPIHPLGSPGPIIPPNMLGAAYFTVSVETSPVKTRLVSFHPIKEATIYGAYCYHWATGCRSGSQGYQNSKENH